MMMRMIAVADTIRAIRGGSRIGLLLLFLPRCTQSRPQSDPAPAPSFSVEANPLVVRLDGSSVAVDGTAIELPRSHNLSVSLRKVLASKRADVVQFECSPEVSMLAFDIVFENVRESGARTWELQVGGGRAGPFRFASEKGACSVQDMYFGPVTPSRCSPKDIYAGHKPSCETIELELDGGGKVGVMFPLFQALQGKALWVRTHAGPY